jgi:hypothetical protein
MVNTVAREKVDQLQHECVQSCQGSPEEKA